jgi:EAL domain-containing protein (putative c-di-GMP-specific phosphodiesterase class I)
MEALARFPQEPARDPSVWFAEADLVGLQLDLELAAVRAAFHGGPPPNGHYLAVNVSPATATSERFHELIRDAPPAAVVIEVTEHAPIDDYEAFRRDLETIRRRGVRLAVDDAGAGFASLNHIVQLSPDFIKLDISLTRRVHRDRNRRALARALISFASEIGATILAEGIEQQEELEALKEIGVAYGQGFYLGRPARPT